MFNIKKLIYSGQVIINFEFENFIKHINKQQMLIFFSQFIHSLIGKSMTIGGFLGL